VPGPLIVDIAGLALTRADRELLAAPEVGGLILFSRNYRDRAQLRALIAAARACQPDLLIAVDQEGGRVQRFRDSFTPLPALQRIGDLARGQPAAAAEIAQTFGWLMAAELLAAGLDLSFAPVLDLDRDRCAAIADRAFADDPQEVSTWGGAYIRGMREAGMAATAKHFPGHGGVVADSHVQLPTDARSLEQIRARDLRPFADLVGEVAAVMPGHLLFPQVDSQPVGFSRRWLQGILRDELGFGGMIFSDDLSMQGAAAGGSYAERARLALTAGCDMVLVCNNRAGALEVQRFLRGFLRESGPAVDARRVAAMRARRSWDEAALRAHPRYRRALDYLQQLADG